MAEEPPNPPVNIVFPETESDTQQKFTLGFHFDMSETQAKAMTDVARYTYAVPARQESVRAIGTQLVTAAIVGYAVWQLMGALLVALAAPNGNGVGAIAAAIATIVGVLAAPTIIKQFRK